jgi:hypothetical protein
MNTE